MKFTFTYYDGETLTIESKDYERAFDAISFRTEERASGVVAELIKELNTARELIDPNHAEFLRMQTEFDSWARSFVAKWLAWIHGHGRQIGRAHV